MSLSPAEREDRIERYARGPARLKAALGRVPEEARKWRPGPGKWSVHEVVCHCADSELNAAARIRYLVAEKDPVLVGYDQEEWARRFDYHEHPLEHRAADGGGGAGQHRGPSAPAARRRLEPRGPPHGVGHATRVDDWLDTYAEHLEKHSGQIDRNLEAWKASRGGALTLSPGARRRLAPGRVPTRPSRATCSDESDHLWSAVGRQPLARRGHALGAQP